MISNVFFVSAEFVFLALFGVLSLQTAHANEAAYADGRRGFERRNGGGDRARAGGRRIYVSTLAIQHLQARLGFLLADVDRSRSTTDTSSLTSR
jgi:hypothetical protein